MSNFSYYVMHCRVKIYYLVSFVICSGRVVSVTFFLLEESDCSRLGTLPFALVFVFRVGTISGGSGITVLLYGLKICYMFVIRGCYVVLTM